MSDEIKIVRPIRQNIDTVRLDMVLGQEDSNPCGLGPWSELVECNLTMPEEHRDAGASESMPVLKDTAVVSLYKISLHDIECMAEGVAHVADLAKKLQNHPLLELVLLSDPPAASQVPHQVPSVMAGLDILRWELQQKLGTLEAAEQDPNMMSMLENLVAVNKRRYPQLSTRPMHTPALLRRRQELKEDPTKK